MPFLPFLGPPNVEKLQSKRDVAGLIRALSYPKDSTIRRAAAVALGEIGDMSSINALKDAIRDSDPAVRVAAITSLGAISAPEATEILVSLLSSSDKTLRRAAADALRPDSLGVTADVLARRAVVQEDWAYAAALGPAAVPPLIELLPEITDLNDSPPIATLVAIGAEAVPPLVAALESYGAPATAALIAIGAPAVPDLLLALAGRKANVRRAAADALVGIGWTPEGADATASYLIAKGEWEECVALGAAAVPALLQTAETGDEALRRGSVITLGKIGGSEVIPTLITVLADPSQSVRDAAEDALFTIGVDSVAPLIGALEDERRGTAAVNVLSRLRSAYELPGVRLQIDKALRTKRAHELRPNALPLVKARAIKSENDLLALRPIVLDYIASGLYVEAIATLGVIATAYEEMALPTIPGFDLDILMRITPNPFERMELAKRKVFSSFDFRPELEAIDQAKTKRREASLLRTFLALQAGAQESDLPSLLSGAFESLQTEIYDDVLIGECVEYLGERITHSHQAIAALTRIPDQRVFPHLLKMFDMAPFFPRGIDALKLLGESIQAELILLLPNGNTNRQFNLALALGAHQVEAAKATLIDLRDSTTDPVRQVGFDYALARFGDVERVSEIVSKLDHTNDEVCHAAAIALEHLDIGLDDAVYLQHLSHRCELVRLRLMRKLKTCATDNPELIQAVIARFDDNNEDVRSAAVDAAVHLGADKIFDQMVSIARGGPRRRQECAYQVLGRLEDARVEPFCLDALNATFSDDIRKSILSALGATQSVAALTTVAKFLNHQTLSDVALWALLQIGMKHRDEALPLLRRHPDRMQRLLALAALGDDEAKQAIAAMLSPATAITDLLQACEYARMLSDPSMMPRLRMLLGYSNLAYAPTDKFIPYAAFKALVHLTLVGE